MADPIAFESSETLLDRLLAAKREIVFLVGAPLTAPGGESPLGVPGVKAMVQRIRGLIEARAPRATRRFEDATKDAENPYQAAFRFLIATLGQEDANAVIRGAVLEAFRPEARPTSAPDDAACAILEKQLDEWHYRPGVAAVGQLAARFPERFGRVVLTTNFDPLVELSIRRAGGRAFSSVFPNDGSIEQIRGEGAHVVHLHGYWYGADTLHDPAQLDRDRPNLRASLVRLLQSRTVVVMAYGGWNDIFMRTLRDLSTDPSASLDVLWCFYDGDLARLRGANGALFDQLRASIGRRVVLYAGIDCHAFLPSLLQELGGAPEMPMSGNGGDMPVMDDADFAGRTAQQNEIIGAFARGQAVQLIGPRRMGKSSMLRWAERQARELGKPTAFVNARGLAGRSPADLVLAAAEAVGKREAVREVLYAERAVPDATDAARALETLAPVFLLVDEADALAEKDHGFEPGFFEVLRALARSGKLQWVSASHEDLFDRFAATGLRSPFLDETRRIHVGALLRDDLGVFLGANALDGFRRRFAWEIAGGFPAALRWLAPRLAAADADPDALEKGLGAWMRPLLQQWWEMLSTAEQALLRRAAGCGARPAELPEEEQQAAKQLTACGFLAEGDRGKLIPGGSVWRTFLRDME